MNWTSLAMFGLFLTFFALISFWFRYREKKRREELGDPAQLRKALEQWEPIVLGHDGTLRGVKRFANRARFLTTDECEDMISHLVGSIALDEIGRIDSSINQFDDESDFEKWKSEELRKLEVNGLDEGWEPTVVDWLKTMTLKHWNRYQALVTLGRPVA